MSKSHLNEYCQKSRIDLPVYFNVQKGHLFESVLVLGDERFTSSGKHATKKMAEEDAAGVALQSIVQQHPEATNVRELLRCADKKRKEAGVAVFLANYARQPLDKGPQVLPSQSQSPHPQPGVPSELQDAAAKDIPLSFVKTLENYCQMFTLPPPVFTVTEDDERFSAVVTVGEKEYRGASAQETEEHAKENATLVALACIGMEALGVMETGIGCSPSVKTSPLSVQHTRGLSSCTH